MAKISKRLKLAKEAVDSEKVYSLEEALELMGKTPAVKFDETVELHFHLNVNPKNSDQIVRGTVALPHGTGKSVRVAVFCQGENIAKAEEAGAEFAGGKELIDKVAGGFLDFDCVIATPDMMKDLSKLGRVLGPRGLMPTPKAGTVTTDVVRAISEVKAGRIEFKSDKQAGIHVGIGKRSFDSNKLIENAQQVVDAITAAKPASVKGNLIKGASLSTTMGAGIKVAL